MAESTPQAPKMSVEKSAELSATTVGQHSGTEAAPTSGGLPQFEFQHWGGQIAYLLILFALLYLLMSRVFAPRIRRIFDERARVISEALTNARSVQAEAATQADAARKAMDDARTKAHKTASDAKAKSAEEAKGRQSALETELSAKLAEAELRIRASRDAAMKNVGAVATDTAQAIVEKLTGVAASPDAVSAAQAVLQG